MHLHTPECTKLQNLPWYSSHKVRNKQKRRQIFFYTI